jgi:hypothetical protein
MFPFLYSTRKIKNLSKRHVRELCLEPNRCRKLMKKYKYSDLRDREIQTLNDEEFQALLCHILRSSD